MTQERKSQEKSKTTASSAKADRQKISSERVKALEVALQQIEKQFGKGSIMKLDASRRDDIAAIPTGSLGLDMAIGIGGVPRGRVVEIFGPESSGKTTLTLSIIAQTQKLGGVAAFIDAEHALDPVYAEKLGVSLKDLLISQPDAGEQALQIAEMLVRSNAVDIVVIDSVAALVPRAELEGEIGDSHMGLQARLMSQALRKLTAVISRSKTCVIFINQIRDKIGIMYGNPETTPGGKALKFYASVRLDIRRIAQIKQGDVVVGNRTRVRVVKNKVAPPFKSAEFDMMFDEGISRSAGVIELGVETQVLQKDGTWFSYKNEKLGQGKEKVRLHLRENPKLLDELEGAVREKILQGAQVGEEAASALQKD